MQKADPPVFKKPTPNPITEPPQQSLSISTEPEILGKHYKRTGYCNGCGHCCQNVSLTFNNNVVQSEAQFTQLKEAHPMYQAFLLQGETEQGLLFKCSHLNEENQCRIYEYRPDFCRAYPSEAGLILGGKLPEECSYHFEPLKPFAETLQSIATATQR
jgi:uncharacterized protein